MTVFKMARALVLAIVFWLPFGVAQAQNGEIVAGVPLPTTCVDAAQQSAGAFLTGVKSYQTAERLQTRRAFQASFERMGWAARTMGEWHAMRCQIAPANVEALLGFYAQAMNQLKSPAYVEGNIYATCRNMYNAASAFYLAAQQEPQGSPRIAFGNFFLGVAARLNHYSGNRCF